MPNMPTGLYVLFPIGLYIFDYIVYYDSLFDAVSKKLFPRQKHKSGLINN